MNKIVFILTLSFILSSCSISNKTKYKYEDIYDIVYSDTTDKNNIEQQIKLREITHNDLKIKIYYLENENRRILDILNYDKSRNIDISSMENKILKNKSLLNKYALQLQKINKEIEILKQKI